MCCISVSRYKMQYLCGSPQYSNYTHVHYMSDVQYICCNIIRMPHPMHVYVCMYVLVMYMYVAVLDFKNYLNS